MALRRVTGLFLKNGRNGKFMSGNTREPIPAGAKLLVFRNDKKQGDADPDYTLMLAEDDDAPQQRPNTNPYRDRAAERQRSADADQRQRLNDFVSERQAVAGGEDVPPW